MDFCLKPRERGNNEWNRFINKCWAPFYDLFFNRGVFYSARKQVFQDFPFREEEDVLFVGAGTAPNWPSVRSKHGHYMSDGTLFPLLHRMELGGLLEKEEKR
jgi:hypothetical protein